MKPATSTTGTGADDRETPLHALEHIIPILSFVSSYHLQCELNQLKVYDPYYCHGTIKIHLESLGLDINRIQNEQVDCYVAQKTGKVKPFDFLLSNPPYSGDHIRRCIHYAVKSNKPWALLLPSNVLHRSWFLEEVKDNLIYFVAPYRRYEFEVGNTSNSHIPFVTMWFIGFPPINSIELKEKITQFWNESSHAKSAVLADSFEGLPRKIRKLLPFTEARANKGKKRKKSEG